MFFAQKVLYEAMLHKETAELVTRLILERAIGINPKYLIIELQKTINGIDYDKLPELVTIWILPFDPFGENMMIYHVKNTVEEIPEMNYNGDI